MIFMHDTIDIIKTRSEIEDYAQKLLIRDTSHLPSHRSDVNNYHIRGESNIDYIDRRFGGGGQPMDVIFPISVAPIDEIDKISLKSGRYQWGVGVKNNVH